MKNYMKGAILAFLGAVSGGVTAQEAEGVVTTPGVILSQIMDAKSASIRARGTSTGEADEFYGQIVYATEDYVLGAENLDISRNEGGYLLQFETLTVNRPDPNSPVITFSDARIFLNSSFFWRNPEDIFCAWTRSASEVNIGAITARLPVGVGGSNTHISIEDLSWTGAPGKNVGCNLTGEGGVRKIVTRNITDSGAEIDYLTIKGNVPLSIDAARQRGALADLALGSDRTTIYTHHRDILHIMSGNLIEFTGTAQSVLPAILIAGKFDPFSREQNAAALQMDIWNMLSVMRADLRWDLGQTQTMTATAIPTEMTANYQSVGLSILSSSIKGLARLRAGTVSVRADTDHVGIGRLDVETNLKISPHSREDLLRADAQEEGFEPVHEVDVVSVDVSWTDSGFNGVFENLFGLRPDKWFQISRTMMEESANAVGTIWIGGVPELYHKGIETFFSDSEEGVVGFALAPEAPVDLQSMIRGYSEDPGAFLRVMRPRRTSHTEG